MSSTDTSDFLGELRKGLRATLGRGVWIGYLGYEYYTSLEKKVPAREPDLIPNAVFCFYPTLYPSPYKGEGQLQVTPPSFVRRGGGGKVDSNFTRDAYLSAIRKIKDYLFAGDCYQVNLSQRFSCETDESPFSLYQKLREISPAPYSAFLNLGDAQILSASPECFLKVEGDRVITRPIKGTRPRGATPEEDARLKEELITSEKDRAELLMITDLLRNDLGKVCRPGSITVPKLAEAETYAQVHHLASTIEGRLRLEADVIDLLKATFPGGSITGAPKIRAMQVIHELETVPRNVYTGTIGYILPDGRAEFNVAIRTMIYKPSPPAGEGQGRGGHVYFWGGGGIVADSDTEAEYEETLAKVCGIREALG